MGKTVLVVETKGLNGKDLADQLGFIQQMLCEGHTAGEGWWIEDADLRHE